MNVPESVAASENVAVPASTAAAQPQTGTPPEARKEKPIRIASIDALRGVVMTLMIGELLHLPGMASKFPGNWFWAAVSFNTDHVQWQGCSLHDLIQPGFSLLVGASLPFSISNRLAKGSTFRRMFGHAVWRAFILIFLGIFLRSLGRPSTYFTFEDTLTQIGLGYVFLFLLGWVPQRVQVAALVVILAGYWALFAFWPAPGPNFDYTTVGVPQNWPLHYTGFLSHWNKNTNPAWAFDVWFLNLFPREAPFAYNGGGYCTLSFIPTLGTMLIGLLAGNWLKSRRPPLKTLQGLAAAGAGLMLLGLIFQWTGICPIVKRIWTPSFTLFSGGLVLLMLSVLYALMEWKHWTRWALPVMIVGMNSIAAYVMAHTMEGFFMGAVIRHLGRAPFLVLGPAFEATLRGAAVMLVFWAIFYWMYKRKIFLRI